MKIVVLDGYTANPGDLSWEPLKEIGKLEVYERTAPSEVLSRAKDAEAVLTNKVVLSADTLKQLKCLKYVGVLATGYNVVDIVEAKKQGITVTNIPAYSSNSVAQMVFAHILNITNRVGYYARRNREGKWSSSKDFTYWDTPLMEISGKTMGIVGLGSIGSRVAKIAHQFGMDVFAVTSKNSADLPEEIHKTTLDGLLATSDILSLHCPLTDSTKEMINAENIAKMKKGAILINTGRGALVNENDVAEALESGHLGGYGADVMCQEPPVPDSPLLKTPNAFITPHIAWATYEARGRLVDMAVANVKAFVEGKAVNVVNK
ncbi:MAG: D-2-hydroxyacid dehydrogenase [Prevotella sp.]|nr:D-2-hydroxyacid dehydrogenase [Prevotella sp.]